MNSSYEYAFYSADWPDICSHLRNELIQLDCEHFPQTWSEELWQQLLCDSGREFYLGLKLHSSDNKSLICGFALFFLNTFDHQADLIKILCRPDYRGQGHGSALLEQCQIKLSKEAGISRFDLEVEASNKAALALYHKLGYREMRRIDDYYGAGLEGVAMQKSLI